MQRIISIETCAVLAAVLNLAVPRAAAGDTAPVEPPPDETRLDAASGPFAEGRWMAGFHAGYALPFQFDAANTDVEDSQFVALIPRFSLGLTDPFGGDHWYRGNIELGLEGHFLIQTQPHSGSFAGGSLLARYNWLALEKRGVVPFLEMGLGIGDLDFGLMRRADGFNFILQSVAGAHWFVWERTALTAQFRYHHISNGKVREPNVAVDSGLFLLGVTVALDPWPTSAGEAGSPQD